MTIHALSRQDFDKLGSAQLALRSLTRKAVEWFADDADNVLGAVADHRPALDWSFVALARDQSGKFRVIALDFGFDDQDVARRLLFAKMETALAPGNRFELPSAAVGVHE
jgi:hypothetical protein